MDIPFEIFTIVAEIDGDMDLVFGFKNMVETEGLLNTRTGEFDFIGRSIPIFPQNDLDVEPGEKAYVKIKAPFYDKLSGMICAKFFSRNVVNTLRVKIQDNQGIVQYINHQDEVVHLRKEKAVGILNLRSVGYFKVGYQKMVNMAESSKVFKMYCKVLLLAFRWSLFLLVVVVVSLLFLLQLCQRSLLLWLCIYVLQLLGNVVRVYPRIVQDLTFLSA